MEDQINVGIQRQSYEPFEAVDSEAENQNADASLAGDSAGANTSGNPDVAHAQVDGESVNLAPPENIASNTLLNRYGISDGIVIQRPEYPLNNRAALVETTIAPGENSVATPIGFIPAPILQPDPIQICPAEPDLPSSGLETAAQVSTKPTEKSPAATTGYAKDAANNAAPTKSHGTTVPPHDSVAYSAARDYGAQHGLAAWEVDQVAALLSYYGCEKQQDCVNLLADGGLPFHISSIMQAIGDPRADGTFDVAYSLRGLQETQIAMSGDRDAGNRLHDLVDGRATGLGVAHISSRAGVGQGDQDYANEMCASSGASDIASIDFSDDSYDAYSGYDSSNNVPPPDLDPLPSLLPVDSNGPIMVPPPDIRLDYELAPLPAITVAPETNSQASITNLPDAQTESAANARAAFEITSANPPLTLNPENGQYGRDYGNGAWTYPLETPQIESHNLLAANTDTISGDTGLIDHLSGIYQAYQRGDISLSDAVSMATGSLGYSARATNAEYSVTTRLGGAAQAAGGFVEALVGAGLSDTLIGAVIGVPIAAHGIDNMFAGERTMVEGNHVPTLTVEALEYVGMSPMAAELTNAGLGLVGTVGPGAVRAVAVGRAAQAEEVAALSLERVEEYAAARTTNGTLGDNGGLYTSTKPLDDVFPELANVNPHYVPDSPLGTNVNCVSCANAAQARLSGLDAEATALPSTSYGDMADLYQSVPLGFQPPTTVAAIEQQMLAAGDGAFGMVLIGPENATQHVVNVVNRDGVVYFVDTQLGRIVTLPPDIEVRLGMPL